jgi:hypothetical protein
VRSKILIIAGLFAAFLTGMAGCGGGSSSDPVSPSTTTATLKLSINGLAGGVRAGALQVSFNLPAGVTPTPLTGGNDASGSISFSGNAVGVQNSFSIATFVSPTVTIGTISIGGLVGGEYITMNCAIDPAATVSATDFPAQATIVTATDNGNTSLPITGLTVPIAVTLQ